MDASVARDKLNSFYEAYSLRHYSKGQILLYIGDRPTGAIQLISGRVRQYELSASGNEVVVNVIKPPAIIPVWIIIGGFSSQYFFEANSDVDIRVAPREDFLRFLKKNPEVMYDFLQTASTTLLAAQRKLAYLMNGSVRERILFEILSDMKRFGIRSADGSYRCRISQTDLAKKSGLSRETINRHLQRLVSDKLVEFKGRILIVKDLNKLEKKLQDSF